MSENFTVMSGWLIPISRAMEANNINIETAFRECTVDPAFMQHQETRLATEKLTRLIDYCNARFPKADASVQIAKQLHPSVFHALGYAMMSSSSLRDALDRIARYKRVVSNTCTLEIDCDDTNLNFIMHIKHDETTGKQVLNLEAVEVFLATIMQFSRRLVNQSLSPIKCMFSHPKPDRDVQYLYNYFQCEIEFDAPYSGLVLDLNKTNERLDSANPLITQAHEQILDRLLAKINRNDLKYLIKTKIYQMLPLGTPSQAEIAESIGMSLRNLQRKLHDQGTSYKEILETTRKKLALDYIREPALSLTEISYLVGFSSVGNFNRAFKRWTNSTPGEYRREQLSPVENS